jgi:hypothetical protein
MFCSRFEKYHGLCFFLPIFGGGRVDRVRMSFLIILAGSVTRLGEISPFGRYFLALGAFFSEKYRPNDLGAIFFKNIAQNLP